MYMIMILLMYCIYFIVGVSPVHMQVLNICIFIYEDEIMVKMQFVSWVLVQDLYEAKLFVKSFVIISPYIFLWYS